MILSVVPVAAPIPTPGPVPSPFFAQREPRRVVRMRYAGAFGECVEDESRALFSRSDVERIRDIAARTLFQLIQTVIHTIAYSTEAIAQPAEHRRVFRVRVL